MIGKKISHYRILDKIGAGGMGIVYTAQDEKLHRQVALKVLRPERVGSEEGRRRFIQEARTAASVTHPFIASIHDAGEFEGTLFIVMEFVVGKTLQALLANGPLDIRDALRYGAEIAEGLGQAHRLHVIHRDLKPGNVIVANEGHAKILDFGLAKLLEERDEATSSIFSRMSVVSAEMTEPGEILGTPAYMSPEQVRGQQVDSRSDVFSFGSTLYQMVTGTIPFRRESKADTLASILRDRPIPPSSLNPEVPPQLEWILDKCLKKDPRDRYQSTQDLVVDLNHLRVQWESGQAHGAVASKTFEATSGAATVRETVSLGVASIEKQAVDSHPVKRRGWRRIHALALGSLGIVAVAVLLWWLLPRPPTPQSPAEVFYTRGIHYLREEAESSSSIDDALQMFHRAVNLDSSFALAWSGLGEAYWMRFELTKDKASHEEATLAVEKALQLDPELADAYNARARGFLAERRYEEAKKDLAIALEKDPGLDVAWMNLGRAHRGLQEYAEGLQAIQQGIRLRPDSFKNVIALGNFFRSFGEFGEAAKAYRRALELKPTSVMAWNNLGAILLIDDPEEAARAFQRSLEIEERASTWSNLGTAYYFMVRFDSSAHSYRRAIELQPSDPTIWGNLGDALRMLGQSEQAGEAYSTAVRLMRERVDLTPGDAIGRARLAYWCACVADRDCALEQGAAAAGLAPENAEVLYKFAAVHCILGQTDAALDWLESAVRFGLSRQEIAADPDLEVLRHDPRYQRILELAH